MKVPEYPIEKNRTENVLRALGRAAIHLFYVKPDQNRQLNRPDLIENLLRSGQRLTFWTNPLFFLLHR